MLLVTGSAIAAYGIDLAIHAGFGGATLAVLWQGIASVVPISVGTASLIVAAVMAAVSFFIDKKQISFGTLIYQLVYGVCVDLFSGAVFYTQSKVLNFALMLCGICVFAFGSALYSYADFGRGSYEALTFAISGKWGFQLRHVRIALDLFFVLSGYFLGGSVGLCTIAAILFTGNLLQFFLGAIKKLDTSKPKQKKSN